MPRQYGIIPNRKVKTVSQSDILQDADAVEFPSKSIFRGVAQLVARDVWDVDAAGSNPVTPSNNKRQRGAKAPLCLLLFPAM